MENKIVEYGTVKDVTVVSASNLLITVVDDNNEGYLLVGHGIKNLPNENDKGTITFTKHNNPTNGYWHFELKKLKQNELHITQAIR